MADITELFGLQAPDGATESSNQADSKDVHPEGTDDKGSLVMTDKYGINFSSYAHTGLPVEVFAMGVGQDEFVGYYDNTDIYNKMAALTGVE